jgi:hypothetical protein
LGFSFFPSLYFMHDKGLILVFRHYISCLIKH